MSLWVDVKYTGLLSPKLNLFKVKTNTPYTANFRCPICGDSQKNKNKARGYVFERKGGLFYKCHNCSFGSSLGGLMKQVDPFLYDQYVMERYRDGSDMGKAVKPHSTPQFTFEAPVFKKKTLLDELLDRLDTCPSDNPAVQYCMKRMIPQDMWEFLYYIDNIGHIEQLSEKYKDRIIGTEPRLVLPFYDLNRQLIGVTCRALGNERLRYVTVKINEDAPLIFGMERVNLYHHVYVVEGPIDSLFLPNCVAVGGTDMLRAASTFRKEATTMVFDNQPRNTELVKIMNKVCKLGYSMMVWPNHVTQKDINEMIVEGYTSNDILDLINKNTFSGLELELAINQWKKTT